MRTLESIKREGLGVDALGVLDRSTKSMGGGVGGRGEGEGEKPKNNTRKRPCAAWQGSVTKHFNKEIGPAYLSGVMEGAGLGEENGGKACFERRT